MQGADANRIRSVIAFWQTFFRNVGEHDVFALSASIAYYATLCLAPMVLLALALIGALYPSAQERFLADVAALVGTDGQRVIRTIVESARERPDLRQVAGWVGAAVLLFGASAVFAQLQLALNRIWGMKGAVYRGFVGFLRRRLLSAGLLLAVLFLTIVSFIAQAAFNLIALPETGVLAVTATVVAFALYAVLFAALYHWLPDGRVPWSTALRGGLLTTALFFIGRYFIGLYLERSDTAGAFGPAGAVVVWLLWAFYSGLIFLFSAELLYSLAHHRGWRWAGVGDIGSEQRGRRPRPDADGTA